MSSLGVSAERALNLALKGKGANYVKRVLKTLTPQLGASLTADPRHAAPPTPSNAKRR